MGLSAAATGAAADPFHVPAWLHWLGAAVAARPRWWIALGNLETRLLGCDARAPVIAPIYIAGLARSGSTILLDLLAGHPAVATHRYRDYPALFTPYAWNRWLDRVPRAPETPRERSHADRLLVTSESPEALEEVIWMAFFPHGHDADRSQILDETSDHPAFEAFYRQHIAKLLRLRGAQRYCAKGNYNVSRLNFLQKLFPDARFIIPVRDPVWHIASSMKQHRLISAAQRTRPRARAYLSRMGHYEFGLDRRPMNLDGRAVREVDRCWQDGREVEGWARHWASVYGHVLHELDRRPALRESVLIVRYEDLCGRPCEQMRRILRHAGLPEAPTVIEAASARLSLPDYYRPAFSAPELETIAAHTAPVARALGY